MNKGVWDYHHTEVFLLLFLNGDWWWLVFFPPREALKNAKNVRRDFLNIEHQLLDGRQGNKLINQMNQ
jgi:hypothetical protein